jgi:hypothetical protein
VIRRGLRKGFEAFRAVDQNVVTPFANKSIRGVGSAIDSGATAFGNMGGRRAASGLWKVAKSPLGMTVGFGAISGAMTYDNSKHDFTQHMGTEMLSVGIDDTLALGAFTLGGPIAGMAYIGAMMLGASPGSIVRNNLEKMQADVQRKRYGSAPITQNKQTMAASRSQLSLLGQGGNYSMLGNEASMMHN